MSINKQQDTSGKNINQGIPLKFYNIADKYTLEAANTPVEAERAPLANYVQLLVTRLMNNQEISNDVQLEMAAGAAIDSQLIDEIAMFLKQQGNE